MSAAPLYRLTVICEGPVNGAWVRVVLAARQSASPDHALFFLRCQARRIADGLDPDPWSLWAPPGTLVRAGPPVPDAPTELRCWCDDFAAQEKARNHLLAGAAFTFRASDHTGLYLLAAAPVPAYHPSTPVPRPGRRRHRRPRWYDRFRLRRRPGRIRARDDASPARPREEGAGRGRCGRVRPATAASGGGGRRGPCP